MTDYTKSTNFASKDSLPSGNALKIVKGTEIDTEFNNIATAIATKTDNASAAITGGTITGITDLAIADGGTGASTASGARTNLGLAAIAASGSASDLSTGTVPVGRLASSGTASSSTYLRGDNTWSALPANVSSLDGNTGAVTLSGLSAFSASIGTNGYQKLPSGLIIQWGFSSATVQGVTTYITLPIAFPNAVFVIVPSSHMATAGSVNTHAYSWSTSGFYLFNGDSGSATGCGWLALGY